MAVKAGVNLAILDNSGEGTTGIVTLKNTSQISINQGVLVFNYAKAVGSSDSGFTANVKVLLNPTSYTAADQFWMTTNTAGTITKWTASVTASSLSGEFYIPIDLPAPITYVIIQINWTGTYANLSPLTVGFLPNAFSI